MDLRRRSPIRLELVSPAVTSSAAAPQREAQEQEGQQVLVEKILFEQPEVGQLYLLIQPRRELDASGRLREQIIPSDAFARLHERHGPEYESFMRSKLTAVESRLDAPNLGIPDDERFWLQEDLDVVVSSAASTRFDERLDKARGVGASTCHPLRAIAINTLGAREVAAFAAGCARLGVFVHPGDCIAEELGRPPAVPLDVHNEIELARRLGAGEMDGEALAEMLVYELVQEHGMGAAIVRPAIIEGAWKEPLPGWMEGLPMADPIIIGYGKHIMDGFAGDIKEGVLDVVPVDKVVAALLAGAAYHAARGGLGVYQVATSVARPLDNQKFVDIVSEAFQRSPLLDREGRPISMERMKVYDSPEAFVAEQRRVCNEALHRADSEQLSPLERRKQKVAASKQFEHLKYLAEVLTPYTFFKCRFRCDDLLRLLGELRVEERTAFNFDVRDIDWVAYLRDIHIPGLRKYVLKGRSGEAE
eukprot:scaffold20.g7739.t1